MPIINHDNPRDEYRVDIIDGSKTIGCRYFSAPPSAVDSTAAQHIRSIGGTHGDVYQLTTGGGSSYYDTVSVA